MKKTSSLCTSSFVESVSLVASKFGISCKYDDFMCIAFIKYLKAVIGNYGSIQAFTADLINDWCNTIRPDKNNQPLADFIYSKIKMNNFLVEDCLNSIIKDSTGDEQSLKIILDNLFEYCSRKEKTGNLTNNFIEVLVSSIIKKFIDNTANTKILDASIPGINFIPELQKACRKIEFTRAQDNAFIFFEDMKNIANNRNINLIERLNSLEPIDEVYNCILSVPTFKESIPQSIIAKLDNNYPNYSLSLYSDTDWLTIIPLIDALSENGILGVVLPESSAFGNDTGSLKMRQFLVENNLIKAIYTLPEKIFLPYSAINCVLYVIGKNNGNINLVDLRSFVPKNFDMKNIEESDYEKIFSFVEEAEKKGKEITNFDNKFSFNITKYIYKPTYKCPTMKLGDLLESLTRGVQITNSELQKQNSTTENSKYRILSNSDIEDCLFKDTAKKISNIDMKHEKFCVSERGVIILSKMGPTFKVGISECNDGEKYLVTNNLFILKVNKKLINPFYLLYFLNSDRGRDLLKNNAAGLNIPTLSNDDVKNIDIPVPEMDIQNSIAYEMEEALEGINTAKVMYEARRMQIRELNDTFKSLIQL
ncbi:N-6 DNA methylase [Treponema sp.]|uniref:N-6 DNA methylase n=1 Tax=Treponema sp. TaxID=166 RepID=UPI00298DB8C8|nr:N-6 DNA methylase [Treponema sp.]MCQ2240437.1 N-6 DNA methylase [Treponema sp.]